MSTSFYDSLNEGLDTVNDAYVKSISILNELIENYNNNNNDEDIQNQIKTSMNKIKKLFKTANETTKFMNKEGMYCVIYCIIKLYLDMYIIIC